MSPFCSKLAALWLSCSALPKKQVAYSSQSYGSFKPSEMMWLTMGWKSSMEPNIKG